VAGLIHDVSHSAFSHCVDYILDEGSEKEHNHQDNIFRDFVNKTEIPSIFDKYNIDTNYILNEHNFPLLERSLPDLCADRLDYSLRQALTEKEKSQNEINSFLENLVVENDYWVFKNFEIAYEYTRLFFKLNTDYFASFNAAKMFRTVGDLMKYALEKEYINKDDLYTTDQQVLNKIKKNINKDPELKLLFDRMDGKIKITNNPDNCDAQVFCKSRIVDPLCKYNGKIRKVSEIDTNWKKIVEKELKPKAYFIKFEK